MKGSQGGIQKMGRVEKTHGRRGKSPEEERRLFLLLVFVSAQVGGKVKN